MENERVEMIQIHRYVRVPVLKDGKKQSASIHETAYIPKSRLGDINLSQEHHFKPEENICTLAWEDKRYTFVGSGWCNGYITARYAPVGVVVLA